jgi:hypothetical protein
MPKRERLFALRPVGVEVVGALKLVLDVIERRLLARLSLWRTEIWRTLLYDVCDFKEGRGTLAPMTSEMRGQRVLATRPVKRLFLLGAAFVLLLLATWTSPSGATFHADCPNELRGCSGGCCFICYITRISYYGDGTYDCIYDDCYTNCV